MSSLDRLFDKRDIIVPFVGTGATMAVFPDNPFARWDGLLEHGIRRCSELGQSVEWEISTVARLQSGDLITYLAVADEVSRRLEERGEWRDWVKRTVGGIKLDGGSPMHQKICSLNRIILTTNYDRLLEDASPKHETLHWKQHNKVQAAIGGNSHAIIHLHGVATNPETVVLGSWQYQALKDDNAAQFWQAHLLTYSLLFIGCGAGLIDPNIGSALEYIQFLTSPSPQARSESESGEPVESYILVRGRELKAAWERFSGSKIYPVAFGREYSDLKQFLVDLAEDRKPEASQDVNEYDTPPRGTAGQPHAAPEGPRGTSLPGLLDLAGPAEGVLQRALDVAQRAVQALGQVRRRSALPVAGRWAAADQLYIHERTAASLMDPIRRLQAETEALADAVHEADAPMGLLTDEQDQALESVFTLVNELGSACEELAEGLGKCVEQIKDNLKLTNHYHPAFVALHDVQSLADDIHETVKTLPHT